MIKTILMITLLGSTAFAGGEELCKPNIKYVTRYVYVDKVVTEDVTRKNRAFLMIGDGAEDRLRQSQSGNSLSVNSTTGTYLGIGYIRDIGRFNLGAHYLSNESIGASLGLNW